MSKGLEIVVFPDPQPDDGDMVLAKIQMSADGTVDAWRLDDDGSHIGFKMHPAPDAGLTLFEVVELLAKACRTVDADGGVVIMHAVLSTAHGCPQPGQLLLIAMPTPDTNPHAVGRIVTTQERPGRWAMPTFTLTVAVENADDAAARAEFPHAPVLDCYPTTQEAERWHAIDEWHAKIHGYGRNHWS